MLLRFRLILACAAVSFGTLALVYLELPLRAGPFRAPLVYGRPATWDGFWYIALATQFHGLISDPLDGPGVKAADLVDLAWAELGVLAIFVPIGFLATIRAAPRYTVLSRVGHGHHAVLEQATSTTGTSIATTSARSSGRGRGSRSLAA